MMLANAVVDMAPAIQSSAAGCRPPGSPQPRVDVTVHLFLVAAARTARRGARWAVPGEWATFPMIDTPHATHAAAAFRPPRCASARP
jgi:hypothetical protein